MKKTIIIAAITLLIGIVISPVAGMAIGETRSLILGLAPEEAILQLADKIDTSKADTEATTQKMQATIDSQNETIANQERKIAEQNTKTETAKAEVMAVTETITKRQNCNADIEKYCYTSSFRDADEFENFLKAYEKMDNYSDYKSKFTKEFDACQKALACK